MFERKWKKCQSSPVRSLCQKDVTLILNLLTFWNKNVTKMIAFQMELGLIISDADHVAVPS